MAACSCPRTAGFLKYVSLFRVVLPSPGPLRSKAMLKLDNRTLSKIQSAGLFEADLCQALCFKASAGAFLWDKDLVHRCPFRGNRWSWKMIKPPGKPGPSNFSDPNNQKGHLWSGGFNAPCPSLRLQVNIDPPGGPCSMLCQL